MSVHARSSSTRRPSWRAGCRWTRSRRSSTGWRPCATTAGGCSSSASAAAPGTPRTRSTTSARSATSRATRRPTTSPSSPRASTTTAGRRRTRRGCAARASAPSDAVLVFSRRRRLARARRLDEPRRRARRRARGRRADLRDRRQARRRDGAGGRRVRRRRRRRPSGCTPHVEAFQAVVWHLIVSHPRLSAQAGKWESTRMTAAVFVDRDGVINEPVWDARTESFESPYRPEDVALVPGAAEALARLRDAGFTARARVQPARGGEGQRRRSPRWTPCTNGWRSCCVRGRAARRRRTTAITIPDFTGPCDCRKPAPGLLLRAADELGAGAERRAG